MKKKALETHLLKNTNHILLLLVLHYIDVYRTNKIDVIIAI